MNSRLLLLVSTLLAGQASAFPDAYMSWQVENGDGLASEWQMLKLDIGIGHASFALHGMVVTPTATLPLTGTCVDNGDSGFRCAASLMANDLTMAIRISDSQWRLEFNIENATGDYSGSGSAFLTEFGYPD